MYTLSDSSAMNTFTISFYNKTVISLVLLCDMCGSHTDWVVTGYRSKSDKMKLDPKKNDFYRPVVQ